MKILCHFLTKIKIDQISFEEIPYTDLNFPFPLLIHSRYSRDQILVALRLTTYEKQSSNREGVALNKELNIEALFVNLTKSEEDFEAAAKLFRQYAAELSIALDFQNFEEELQQLKSIYAEAFGGIVLCKENNIYIGCAGIRKFDVETAEVKRMWVNPSVRGKGIGEKILKAAIVLAKSKNHKAIVLDTLDHMHPAIKLYKEAGFKETESYYFNPHKNTLYFKKII